MSQAPAFAASLSTANNDDSDDGDIVFDIQIGAADITITSLATRFNASAGVVSAYYVLGGYAASPTLSSWTLWDSTDLTGTGGYAGWDVTDQIFAAGQTYGVYLQDGGDGFAFGDGGGAGSVLASDAALTIFEGGSDGLPPTASGAWNGTIVYTIAPPPAVPLPAALPLAPAGFGALVALGRRRRA